MKKEKIVFFLKRFIKFIVPYGIVELFKQKRTSSFNKVKFPHGSSSCSYKGYGKLIKDKVCIFACFSKNGIIPESDIYYIQQLSKLFTVIVVGDCKIFKSEITKIKKYINFCYFKRHKKYDFGSYYLGYKIAIKERLVNNETDILLANNSCFGPIFNLDAILNDMQSRNCDFWGLNSSLEIRYHLQSYFIYFKRTVIKTSYLLSFLKKIRIQKNAWDVVCKYETSLSNYLINKGFKSDSYVPLRDNYIERFSKINKTYNKMASPIYLIKKYNFPLIKKKIFINNYENYCKDNLIDILDLIKKYNSDLYEIIKKESLI